MLGAEEKRVESLSRRIRSRALWNYWEALTVRLLPSFFRATFLGITLIRSIVPIESQWPGVVQLPEFSQLSRFERFVLPVHCIPLQLLTPFLQFQTYQRTLPLVLGKDSARHESGTGLRIPPRSPSLRPDQTNDRSRSPRPQMVERDSQTSFKVRLFVLPSLPYHSHPTLPLIFGLIRQCIPCAPSRSVLPPSKSNARRCFEFGGEQIKLWLGGGRKFRSCRWREWIGVRGGGDGHWEGQEGEEHRLSEGDRQHITHSFFAHYYTLLTFCPLLLFGCLCKIIFFVLSNPSDGPTLFPRFELQGPERNAC